MGVAIGEDAAVLGDEPVPTAVRSRGHPDDGRVEGLAATGSVEVGVAIGEDAAVVGDEPVPAAVRSRGDPDDGRVEGLDRRGIRRSGRPHRRRRHRP